MKVSICLCFLLALCFFQRTIVDAKQSKSAVRYVVEHLDANSLPSSVGFKREKGKITFADYGFHTVSVSAARAVLEPKEQDWRYTVTVLRQDKRGIGICVQSRGVWGSTYYAEETFLLKPEGNRLKAAPCKDLHCPTYSE